jgi:hypothetical protein
MQKLHKRPKLGFSSLIECIGTPDWVHYATEFRIQIKTRHHTKVKIDCQT